MNTYVIAARSLGITASSTLLGVETCGEGMARLLRIERKGEGTTDRRRFVLKDSGINVPVINTMPVPFTNGTRILLGFDETGAHVVINNICP